MADSPIERAALRWIEARTLRDGLKVTRAGFRCAHEAPLFDEGPESGGIVDLDKPAGKACWKGRYVHVGPDDHAVWEYERHPHEWCASCRERQDVHTRYLTARKLTGARMAALTRVCRAAHLRQEAPRA